MYSVVFEKSTGKVIEKGASDVSRFSSTAVGVLAFPLEPRAEWSNIKKEHLVVDNPSSVSPVLREMTRTEKTALKAIQDAQEAARLKTISDGEQAVIDGMVISEEQARAKGTPEGTAMADRILAEIDRRKAALAAA